MTRAVCIKSFQFRGGVVYAGRLLRLTDAEFADGFVAAHVKALADGETPPVEARDYFGNGVEKKRAGADATGDDGDPSAWKTGRLVAYLVKNGVSVPAKTARERLVEMAVDVKNATAGADSCGDGPARK